MSAAQGLSGLARGAAPSADPAAARRAALRQRCQELEGVFVRQLFEAMRKATPQESPGGGSTGEGMFTAMLDDAMAGRAAAGFERGLGESLYRQLSRRLEPAAEPPAPEPPRPGGAR